MHVNYPRITVDLRTWFLSITSKNDIIIDKMYFVIVVIMAMSSDEYGNSFRYFLPYHQDMPILFQMNNKSRPQFSTNKILIANAVAKFLDTLVPNGTVAPWMVTVTCTFTFYYLLFSQKSNNFTKWPWEAEKTIWLQLLNNLERC